jgi:hypothetical protein
VVHDPRLYTPAVDRRRVLEDVVPCERARHSRLSGRRPCCQVKELDLVGVLARNS